LPFTVEKEREKRQEEEAVEAVRKKQEAQEEENLRLAWEQEGKEREQGDSTMNSIKSSSVKISEPSELSADNDVDMKSLLESSRQSSKRKPLFKRKKKSPRPHVVGNLIPLPRAAKILRPSLIVARGRATAAANPGPPSVSYAQEGADAGAPQVKMKGGGWIII
jgi:hypothetical protein